MRGLLAFFARMFRGLGGLAAKWLRFLYAPGGGGGYVPPEPEQMEAETESYERITNFEQMNDLRRDASGLRLYARQMCELSEHAAETFRKLGPAARRFAISISISEVSVLASTPAAEIRQHLSGKTRIPHVRSLDRLEAEPEDGLQFVMLNTDRARRNHTEIRRMGSMGVQRYLQTIDRDAREIEGKAEAILGRAVSEPQQSIRKPKPTPDERADQMRRFIDAATPEKLDRIRERLGDVLVDRVLRERDEHRSYDDWMKTREPSEGFGPARLAG